MKISTFRTDELSSETRGGILELCSLAFGSPFDELFDFVGPSGVHVMLNDDSGDLSSHCVVTERTFWIGEHGPMRAGYIDAVATRPTKQGLGYGRAVMAESCLVCKSMGMDIMGLSTFIPEWYGSMGWKEWNGELGLRNGSDISQTSDLDGVVMVYGLAESYTLDLSQRLIASWRPNGGW